MSKSADTYVVELQAKTSSYNAKMKEAQETTREAEKSFSGGEDGVKSFGEEMTRTSSSTKKFSSSVESVSSKITTITGKFSSAAAGVGSFVSKIAGATTIATVTNKAINAVISGVTGMVGDMEEATAAWTTFEANMQMNGHTADEIAAAKKSMQDYASATVYSASEMASAYAQLDAVGVQNVEQLVKGIGGLAASASDPSQAMKSLMTQITQAAGKSTIAWQDFRIMLEQAPAGVSAVAKSMGMTTSELVSNIQDGKVATQDFLNAVASTGTNANFTALSTQFKTVSQAIDGAKESISNKLQPAFSSLQTAGIKAVEAISGALEKLTPIINAVIGAITSALNLVATGIAKLTGQKLTTGTTQITGGTSSIDTSAYDSAEDTADAQTDIADNTNSATKATKAQTRAVKEATKAQNAYNASTLSFDVTHKLGGGSSASNGESSGDAGSGTVTAATAATSAIDDTGASALSTLGDIDTALSEISTEETTQPAIIDKIKSKFDSLKPIITTVTDEAKVLAGKFKDGFKLGLGDTTQQMDLLKGSISSLKDNFISLLTDSDIQTASKNFSENLAETLGMAGGTAIRVGLDIGANVVGGISQYVEENKPRIKEHMLSMFDICDDLQGLMQRTFGSIGTLADALVTPQAVSTTSNIVGIFADAGMGLSELFLKAKTDFLELLLDPINDNIDLIRENLDGFIGFLDTITGTIKGFIDDLIDKVNSTYDEHIKPVIDTITEAISGLVTVISEDWKEYVQPVLDKWGEKFKELYEEHIGPAMEKVQDAIGAVCDILSPIIEKYIAPLISILIDTLFPPVTAFIGWLGSTALDAIGAVADVIGGVCDVLKTLFEWIGKIINKLPSLEGISSWFHNGTATSWGFGSIAGFANGGQVNSGQIFMARENGMAEMVGQIGTTTTVANNDQIVSAVSSGVAQAVAGVMGQYSDNGGDQEIVIQVDSEELARAVSRGNKRRNIRTNPQFAYS